MIEIDSTLQDRKNTHGEYTEHARCAQAIIAAVMSERNWREGKLSPIQRESLHMFAHKMGRIAVGDPDQHDHWHDIAGYAKLVEDRIPRAAATAPDPELLKKAVERLRSLPQNVTLSTTIDRELAEKLASPFRAPRDRTEEHDMRPRTPDDGGQHAALAPWVVRDPLRYAPFELADRFWRQIASGTWALEAHVESRNLPRDLDACYTLSVDGAWVVQIDRVPPDAREYFPSLALELNGREREKLMEWQRQLYALDEPSGKWKLRDAAWYAETE